MYQDAARLVSVVRMSAQLVESGSFLNTFYYLCPPEGVIEWKPKLSAFTCKQALAIVAVAIASARREKDGGTDKQADGERKGVLY